RLLAVIFCEHFFVQAIWISVYLPDVGHRASVLEITGTQGNIDMAEYVHGFLLEATSRLYAERRRSGAEVRGGRRSFAAGVMSGFLGKLNEERRAQRAEGLIWVGDADL